ncbi:MAG: T9SS type A sorting domain-containing protein [Bacteroidetes bacterium]|nr:T9SS type A sorting domain-containing protein [Bacteroidota bacterium]
MNKLTKLFLLITAILIFSLWPVISNSQIYVPDGVRMPGAWNGWTNTTGMGGSFDLQRISSGTLRWQTIFQYTGTTGAQQFKFVSTSFSNPWGNQWAANTTVGLNSLQNFTYGTPSEPNNSISVTQNKWYTVIFEDSGYENTRAVFMETDAQPVNITAVVQTPPLVEATDNVLITTNLSASPSAQEIIYLRYTTDNWTSSVAVEMTKSGNQATATIPAIPSDTRVEYYIFSSVVSALSSNYDLHTIKFNNNSGSNYYYVVDQEISCGQETSLITTDPAFPRENTPLTVYFNAEFGNGGLFGYAGNVYAHTGVITNLSGSNTDWKYVVTQWGENTPETMLQRLGPNLYSLYIEDIREYYDVPAAEDILKLAFVFRSDLPTAGGYYLEHKTSSNSDILIDVYELSLNVKILSPSKREPLVSPNQLIPVCVEALENETLELYLNDDLLLSDATASLTYPLVTSELTPGTHWIIAKAISGANAVYDSTAIYLRGPVVEAPLPAGVINGVNIHEDNSVTFVLHDPAGFKEFAFVIGDFSNWQPNDDNYMKKDPATNRFWVTIVDLEPQKEYAFQYFIDNELKLGCAYSQKILDPWNDRWISETTYPDLKSYPFDLTTGIVSVFEIDREPYQWEIVNFTPSALNATQPNLVIYELLIRDFVESSSILEAIDKLDYLKTLGVNAIELMPIMEFDGNDSWGYAPNFFFAPDKYYGTRHAYKKFIDECHKRDIAVILDIVPNHAFGQNPMAMMYFDHDAGAWGQPAANNPWFNAQATHPYSVGYDFNHESIHTREFFKRIYAYWLNEFKVDGFRVDLSKGLTQNNSGDDLGAWSAYDQSRINILMDYYNHIKSVKSSAYVILEHFANNDEEVVLANAGNLMWGDMNVQFNQNTMGWNSNHDFSWAYFANRGFTYPNLIPYMESHDEERLMYRNLEYGNSGTNTLESGLQRMAAAVSMYMTIPGPKMIWQFGELGYDYSINYCPDGTISGDCRTSRKPVRWDYLNNPDRQRLFLTYAAMIKLKTQHEAFRLGTFSQDLSGMGKRMWIAHSSMNVVVSANFSTTGFNMQPGFQNTGTWYNYLTGESFQVNDMGGHTIYYNPGDFYIFVNQNLGKPFFDVAVTVISDVDESPIENAKIDLGPAGMRMSDANGEGVFVAMPGDYTLTVSKYGWETYINNISIAEDLEIVIRMVEAEMPDTFNVTFNVDMSQAGEFDAELDKVYISGIPSWIQPGNDPSLELSRINESMIYTIAFELEAGDYEYKYFMNAGWDGGEWAGGPNREITVVADMVINDVFGVLDDDDPNISDFLNNVNVVLVYPNPTSGILNISKPSNSIVFIYDMNGNRLFEKFIPEENTHIDMRMYNSGLYFIKIVSGKNVIVKKVIKN